MNIITIIKYDLILLFKEKTNLIILFMIIPLATFFSFYISSSVSLAGKVAIIGENQELVQLLNEKQIKHVTINEPLSKTDMILSPYIGVFQATDKGFEAISESPFLKNNLDSNNAKNEYSDSYKIIVRAMQFMMIILIIQSVLNLKNYTNTINSIQLDRVIQSNCSFTVFTWGTFFSNVISISIPYFLSLLLTTKILSISISIWTIFALNILGVFLSSSVAIFVCTIIKGRDNAIMVGNIFGLLSSLLSGSFGEINHSSIFFKLSKITPQYYLYQFANSYNIIPLIITCCIIVFSIIIATYKNKNRKR